MEDITNDLPVPKRSIPKRDSAGRTRAAPVQVQCQDFRCLAVQDKEGRWLDYHSGKLLTGEVRIVDYSRD